MVDDSAKGVDSLPLASAPLFGGAGSFVRYLSLALMSAWILLVTTGDVAIGFEPAKTNPNFSTLFYVCSGSVHALSLLFIAAFRHRVGDLVAKRRVVIAAGIVSSFGTLVVSLSGSNADANMVAFGFISAAIGLANAVIIIRIGEVFSDLCGRTALFVIGAAGMLANLLFFMCVSLPPLVAVAVVSLFPIASVLLVLVRRRGAPVAGVGDPVPESALPKGYFPRLLAAVFVFSLAAGVVRYAARHFGGITAAHEYAASLTVFCSFAVLLALVVAVAFVMGRRALRISRVYYSIIVLCSVSIVLSFLMLNWGPLLQSVLAGTAYNVLILVIWCLLTELSGRTTLGPERTFGFGRGFSALGTTVGQVASLFLMGLPESDTLFLALFATLLIAVVVATTLSFDEQTLFDALEKTEPEFAGSAESHAGRSAVSARSEQSLPGEGAASASALLDDAASKGGDQVFVDPIAVSSAVIAERYELTPREKEVLVHIARGRSATFVSDNLGISYNTAKGYIRNVYAKTFVHSRQELLDLVQSVIRERVGKAVEAEGESDGSRK